MKKTRLILLIFCLLTIPSSADQAQAMDEFEPAVPVPKGWKLVWHDEFNSRSLDLTKWTPENAALEKNNEMEYYTPEEVYLQDGNLVLRSSKRAMGRRKYTSGLVETRGKFTLLYGRVEIRAKLPKGQGIWPAHWMMPDDNSWPPEIDIMELIGHRPDKVHMTVHWSEGGRHRNTGESFVGPDFSKNFHVFAVEWEDDEIRWYVDGKLRFRTRDSIPRVPLRIILNTAVGGDWPGAPGRRTVFPQYHLIDYVRVYEREK